MSRWGVRAVGILMLLMFAVAFYYMYRQLVALHALQRQQPAATQTRR